MGIFGSPGVSGGLRFLMVFFRLLAQIGAGVGLLLQHEALRGPCAWRRVGRGGEVPQRLHQGGGQPLLHEDLL